MTSDIEVFRQRLILRLASGASELSCLRDWSLFIRARDGNRCLKCGGIKRLSAHHIFRKTFLREARFEPGNGLTLCSKCHSDIHKGYNGRPDFNLPMDAEGGEKIEIIVDMLWTLLNDARLRGQLSDEWYFLSDSTLAALRLFQGFGLSIATHGTRLEQAFWIWNQAPLHLVKAVLEANGFGAD